jgi:CHAT domain-containing protein/tetratricopeptide (TPR) repeat protein
MEIDTLVQQVLDNKAASVPDMSPDEIAAVVEHLKAEADRHWRIDPNISLQRADEIIRIGESVQDTGIVALGTMARGDALRYLHRVAEGWDTLGRAGDLYLEAGDEVGWARTRIGRLAICVEMDAIQPALQDAEAARDTFREHRDFEKLVRLETNAAAVLNHLAKYPAVIEKYQEIIEILERIPHVDSSRFINIYINLGYAHQGLGHLQKALDYYERARELMVERDEKLGLALADLFIISVAQAQGHSKKALRLLHKTIDVLAHHQAIETSKETWHLVECYLFLNRFRDAHELAGWVVQQHPPNQENYDLAKALLQLAATELALDDYSQVFTNLLRAEQILEHLNAVGWLGTVHLYRGQAAFRLGDLAIARVAARNAAAQFRRDGQQISYLLARLLLARVEIADGQVEVGLEEAHDVQKMAHELNIPHLSYETYLLLGKIAEQLGTPRRAIRHYQVATGIMERIQRSLVLTSRPDFLADKQESVQALVRLNLELGQIEAAFAALERAKAQVWLGYLSQLDHLRWLRDDPQTQPLIDELSRLREEHHWYYRAAHDPVFREQQHVVIASEEAAQEASIRERRLRALTEQLYLHSSAEDLAAAAVVPLSDIQARLADRAALVAYYSDGSRLWAFLLDSQRLDVWALPQPVPAVETLLEKWQLNINRALRAAPNSDEGRMLDDHARSLSRRLYEALILPFAARLHGCERLVVVPYGALHYLPFQLLHDGQGYLIERAEVVVLPAASLITAPSPRQQRHALALAYSWDGRLPHSLDEARRVAERFGGRLYSEAEASRSVLSAPPCQVLHISAHGQHRMDQPDFSFIQLADGPLYTDDLFQHDLRYELVTLSACETGRSQAAAGDELIGLGRGFLFAGAGALIASLWRVDEALTLELMDELYRRLDTGVSKAAALRAAQLALMRAYPGLHPAFWGAFELIGSADPLTKAN